MVSETIEIEDSEEEEKILIDLKENYKPNINDLNKIIESSHLKPRKFSIIWIKLLIFP